MGDTGVDLDIARDESWRTPKLVGFRDGRAVFAMPAYDVLKPVEPDQPCALERENERLKARLVEARQWLFKHAKLRNPDYKATDKELADALEDRECAERLLKLQGDPGEVVVLADLVRAVRFLVRAHEYGDGQFVRDREPGFTIDGAVHPLDCGCAGCVALQEHYAGLAADIPQGGEGNE